MNIIDINVETGEAVERPMTAAELAEHEAASLDHGWRNLRTQRDALLKASDWTVLPDTPTPTAAWKAYRQALRDLPGNTTDPYQVDWPTPPA